MGPKTALVFSQIFNVPVNRLMEPGPMGPGVSDRDTKVQLLKQLLLSAGVPNTQVLNWVVAMVMLETGYLTNTGSRVDNNLSGITWDSRYFPASMKGSARPKTEGGYYVKFDTLEQWAKVYVQYLTKKAAPIQAATIEDFVSRLKRNGYMRAPESIYLNTLRGVLERIKIDTRVNTIAQQEAAAAAAEQDPNNPANWWKKLALWQKGGVVLLGVIIVKKLLDK